MMSTTAGVTFVGGKFTNGALTGAFSRLFNDLGGSDIWNQKARSREIEINRLTGMSDEEFISATAWETQSLSDGINNKAVALLRRVLGRALTVTYQQSRTVTYGQFDEIEVYRYRTVYDVVNGRVSNEQILYGSETFVGTGRVLTRGTKRETPETRTCIWGFCSQ